MQSTGRSIVCAPHESPTRNVLQRFTPQPTAKRRRFNTTSTTNNTLLQATQFPYSTTNPFASAEAGSHQMGCCASMASHARHAGNAAHPLARQIAAPWSQSPRLRKNMNIHEPTWPPGLFDERCCGDLPQYYEQDLYNECTMAQTMAQPTFWNPYLLGSSQHLPTGTPPLVTDSGSSSSSSPFGSMPPPTPPTSDPWMGYSSTVEELGNLVPSSTGWDPGATSYTMEVSEDTLPLIPGKIDDDFDPSCQPSTMVQEYVDYDQFAGVLAAQERKSLTSNPHPSEMLLQQPLFLDQASQATDLQAPPDDVVGQRSHGHEVQVTMATVPQDSLVSANLAGGEFDEIFRTLATHITLPPEPATVNSTTVQDQPPDNMSEYPPLPSVEATLSNHSNPNPTIASWQLESQSRSHDDVSHTSLVYQIPQSENDTPLNPHAALVSLPAIQYSRRDTSRDDELLALRAKGISYREIKANYNFEEAESTLRGRYRTLTKAKEARVRKPEWGDNIVQLLFDTVEDHCRAHLGLSANDFLRTAEGLMIINDPSVLQKVGWKKIAESMAEAGTYHYGNATVKKKYVTVREEKLGPDPVDGVVDLARGFPRIGY